MVDERDPPHGGVVEASPPVSPPQACDDRGQAVTYDRDDRKVPPVLPLNDFILPQIADVRWAWLHRRFDQHPPDVAVEQAALSVVGIQRSVGITVVGAVPSSPPEHGTLHRAGPHESEEVLQWSRSIVGPVGP